MPLPATPQFRAALSSPLLKGAVAATSVTIAIAVIGHTWYWQQGISAVEQTVAAWTDRIREQGGRVALSGLAYSGYPFSFEVSAEAIDIESASSGLVWSWRGGAAQGQARVWSPNTIAVHFTGNHEWRMEDEGNGNWSSMAIGNAVTDFTLSDGMLIRLIATLNDVRAVGNSLLGPVATESVMLSGNLENGVGSAPSFRTTGRLRQTCLPIADSFPLGTTIDQLAWNLTASAPLPSSATLQEVTAWRDDGGTIEIDSLALRWGTLTVDARGTLSLDDRYRPLAALSATVRGHRAAVDSLVQAGTIRPAEGAAAKIALSVFSDAAENGGIVLPLTAQDGWLTAGPVRISPLYPLDSFLGPALRP